MMRGVFVFSRQIIISFGACSVVLKAPWRPPPQRRTAASAKARRASSKKVSRRTVPTTRSSALPCHVRKHTLFVVGAVCTRVPLLLFTSSEASIGFSLFVCVAAIYIRPHSARAKYIGKKTTTTTNNSNVRLPKRRPSRGWRCFHAQIRPVRLCSVG